MSLALKSRHPALNTDLTWDNRYPLGDKVLVQPSPLQIDLDAFNAAGINLQNLQQNVAFSQNYRQFLTGDSADSAVLSVAAITGSLGNWGIPADDLVNPDTITGSGSIQVSAFDGAQTTVTFPVQSWSILSAVQQGNYKFHPGHYGASAGIMFKNDLLSKFTPEMDDMMKDLWIKGYRLFVTWSHLDKGPFTFSAALSNATSGTVASWASVTPPDGSYFVRFSNGTYKTVTKAGSVLSWSGAITATAAAQAYNFQQIDAVLNRMKTKYSAQKYLVLSLLVMSFGIANPVPKTTDSSIIPEYILHNTSLYGNSPNTDSGWWGPAIGTANGAYTAAIYRTAVAQQYANLGAALGAKYNSDPNFEAILDQENSAVQGPATARNTFGSPSVNDGSYSDNNYVNNCLKTIVYPAWRNAFPNTMIGSQDSFVQSNTIAQNFVNDMQALKIAMSSADTVGHSYNKLRSPLIGGNWGLQAYTGQKNPGPPISTATVSDRRGIIGCLMDVEGPDIAPTINPNRPGSTPLDNIKCLNLDLGATHAFWCHVPSGHVITPPAWSSSTHYAVGDQASIGGAGGTWYEALTANTNSSPPNANWKVITSANLTWAQVTAVLQANPLTNTTYPSNFP